MLLAFNNFLYCALQVFPVNRLQKIIQCTETNGLDGILVVACCKNDLEIYFRDLLKHFKPVHFWHFNIKKDNLWLLLLYCKQGILAGIADIGHFHIGTISFQQYSK
jgi:hypothetical protein